MRVFGLTGGIASGKSTVAKRFRQRVPVIDADQLAREVVEPGQPGLLEVKERFGAGVLLPDGSLNRARLGEMVFGDEPARLDLNQIIHPRVQALLRTRLNRLSKQGEIVACYEVPLLFESQLEGQLRPVVLVSAKREHQIARAMKRNAWTRAQAEARVNAQLPLSDKEARADYVIVNDGPLEETLRQADSVLDAVLQQLAV